jgi:putative addiction module killer protein
VYELRESETFKKWRDKLADRQARLLIALRLARLASGHDGDIKPVGEGVLELRIHHGPGYRVYLQKRDGKIVILLCGGDKSTQDQDIAKAKRIAKEWSNDHG